MLDVSERSPIGPSDGRKETNPRRDAGIQNEEMSVYAHKVQERWVQTRAPMSFMPISMTAPLQARLH
jgi:hypothetical protein